MTDQKYTSSETQWCPGCGNFSILATVVDVMNDMNILQTMSYLWVASDRRLN